MIQQTCLSGYGDMVTFLDTETQVVYIRLSDIEKTLGWRRNDGRKKLESKSLEPLLLQGLTVGKKVEISTLKTKSESDGKVRSYTAVPLDLVSILLAWEALNGNLEAVKLLATGFSDSISSLTFEQLGQKQSTQERLEKISARLQGIETRKGFTYILQQHCKFEDGYQYAVATLRCYEALGLGKRYVEFRKEYPKLNFRDSLDAKDLLRVERLEDFLVRRLTVKGENFEQALAAY